MNGIHKEILTIDKGLIYLDNELIQIADLTRVKNQDIDKLQQEAKSDYQNSLNSIKTQKSELESQYAKVLKTYEEQRYNIRNAAEQEIINNKTILTNHYGLGIRKIDADIRTIEKNLSKFPQKKYNKILSQITVTPASFEMKSLEEYRLKMYNDTLMARVCKALFIFGYKPTRIMKKRFVQDSLSYKAYLENEKTSLERKKDNDINQVQNNIERKRNNELLRIDSLENNAKTAYERSIESLKKQQQQAYSNAMQKLKESKEKEEKYDELLKEKQKIFESKRNYFLSSDVVTGFDDRIKGHLKGSGFSPEDWSKYDPSNAYSKYSIGECLIPTQAKNQQLISKLSSHIPNRLKEGFYRVPLLFNSEKSQRFFMQYNSSNKGELLGLTQLIVVQRLRCSNMGKIDVYLSEIDRSGQILGPLAAPVKDNEEINVFNKNSKDEIRATLKKISGEIDEINGVLGNCSDIYEYNNQYRPKIKERCFVLVDVEKVFDKDDWETLGLIWKNSARCGITLIMLSSRSAQDIPSLYPHNKIDVGFLQSNDVFTIYSVNDITYIASGKTKLRLFAGRTDQTHRQFVDEYRKMIRDNQMIDNKFSSYFDVNHEYEFKDSTKEIRIPIMVDIQNGDLCDFVIDSEQKAHTMITGGTGCGKTTLLHAMVGSIIMNYSPEDVELWLIDYGKTSFPTYIDNRPKHIRLIAIEDNEDFSRSLIDAILKEQHRRQQLFDAARVSEFSEYRATLGVPVLRRLVIFIDEAHNLALHSKIYDVKGMNRAAELTKIFKEVRKYGISLVVITQSKSGSGFAESALEQMPNKLAMKQNQVKTIIDDLPSLTYTDEDKLQLNSFEAGHIAMKTDKATLGLYRGLYLSSDQLKSIIQTSNNRCADMPNEKIKIVDSRKPYKVSIDDFNNYVTKPTNDNSYIDLTLCLGKPTTLDDYYDVNLTNDENQNVMVFGTAGNVVYEQLYKHIWTSVCASCKDAKIVVCADPKDKRFKKIRNVFASVHHPDVAIYETHHDILNFIQDTSEKMDWQRQEKTVVFWFGMERFVNAIKKNTPVTSSVKPQINYSWSNGFFSDDDEDNNTSALPINQVKSYNAAEVIANIDDIFTNGGDNGIHNIVDIECARYIKEISAINIRQFEHFILLSLLDDDAMLLDMMSIKNLIRSGYKTNMINDVVQQSNYIYVSAKSNKTCIACQPFDIILGDDD